jgi:hypothetical protein
MFPARITLCRTVLHVFIGAGIFLAQMRKNWACILGKWPTWRTILYYVFILTLYMVRAHCAHNQERQIVSIQPLVSVTLYRCPCRVQVGSLPIQSDRYQRLYWYNLSLLMMSTMYSKHVESWNKYIVKHCASRWSFTKHHNTKHGQQHVKFWACMSSDYAQNTSTSYWGT